MRVLLSSARLDHQYTRRIATLPWLLTITLIESSYTHLRAAVGWIKCDMRQAWNEHWDADA